MSINRVLNLAGLSTGAVGVVVGLSTHWPPWAWLSAVGLVLCLIAAPSIWARSDG